MATISEFIEDQLSDNLINSVKHLLWGTELKDEVFQRWTQAFMFSEVEQSALMQLDGGPCAVIAPVQAYLLKNILFDVGKHHRDLSPEECSECLLNGIIEIFEQVSPDGEFCVVSLDPTLDKDGNTLEIAPSPAGSDEEMSTSGTCIDEGHSSPKRMRYSHQLFHSRLRCSKCSNLQALSDCIRNLNSFKIQHGVLLFLYSIILTKGIEQIKNEVEDPGEPLIDGTYGHGSQSLINLLLSGKAVSNVFDNDQDVTGFKLQGITSQCRIGFLTILEHLRYCEVGWNLKNPKFPIWVLGSETHLTVLFSAEQNLVVKETKESQARQAFHSYDPEGNGFITCSVLRDLMKALDLVSEQEYVDIMQKKLDPEGLGIVLLYNFMAEFFPDEEQPTIPEKFIVYHYNGIPRSCPENKVVYLEGTAKIQDICDIIVSSNITPVLLCLQTKWPTIDLQWRRDHVPSII